MSPRDVDRSEARVLELGRELIMRLATLFRAVVLYEADNDALLETAEKIRGDLKALAEEGVETALATRRGSLFVGGQRIREGAVASSSYQRLVDTFRAAEIGTVHLDDEVSPRELQLFARLVREVTRGERAPAELGPELRVRGVEGIELQDAQEQEELADELDAEAVARRIYLRSIGVVKTVFHELRQGNRLSARRVKRVVQEMIESLDRSPGYLMNLTSLKNYDEYTFNHSVNVGVLAIALGRQVGLARKELYAIGQAGMLHDLGKLCVPKELLNKPGRLTAEERAVIQAHPVDGFLSVASQLGVSEDTIGVALAAYEHHVNEDGTGYPEAAAQRRKQLGSRIVSLVDRYDAMTSARVYRGEPIPPPKTLAIMYHGQKTHHDSLLLRYFLNLVGYYPLGTTVQLSDGSVAVVVGGPEEPGLRHLPLVRLVLEPDGRPASGHTLDLAASAKDRDPIAIEEILDGSAYGIEVMDYLL